MEKMPEKYLILVDKDVEGKNVVDAILTVGEANKNFDVNILTYNEIINPEDNDEVVKLLADTNKYIVVNNIDSNCFGYLSDEMYGVILGLQTHQDKVFYYRNHVLEASPVNGWSISRYGSDFDRYYAEHLNTVKRTGRR